MLVSGLDSDHCEKAAELCRMCGGRFDIAAELERPNALIWVARPALTLPPIGMLLAWVAADERHLLHLGTHPKWRRRGAARALLGALLTSARASRARLVLLEVRRSNESAIALYRSCGFSAVSVRRNYYADTQEDAIEMMLTLDPDTGSLVPSTDQVSL